MMYFWVQDRWQISLLGFELKTFGNPWVRKTTEDEICIYSMFLDQSREKKQLLTDWCLYLHSTQTDEEHTCICLKDVTFFLGDLNIKANFKCFMSLFYVFNVFFILLHLLYCFCFVTSSLRHYFCFVTLFTICYIFYVVFVFIVLFSFLYFTLY